MATKLYVDKVAGRLVQSFTNSSPASPSGLFRGDVLDVEVYFLAPTGIAGQPYAYTDESSADMKFALGDKDGLPASGTWTLDGNTLQYGATASDLQTALRTSQSDASLTVTGSMAAGFVITWGSAGVKSLLTGSSSGLTPACDLTILEKRAGTVSVIEQQFVRLRQSPIAYQATWTNVSTTVTATVTTPTAGSSTENEVQKIAWNIVPALGTFRITLPADTRTQSGAVVGGVFVTTANHGFSVGQPVSFSGFTNEANFTEGTRYYVAAVPSPTSFTISATSGGSAITTATADSGSGTITTVSRQTDPIAHNATTAQVQAALEDLDSIASGDVVVDGVVGEYYTITFTGNKGYANIPAVTVSIDTLAGAPGKTAEVDLNTFQAIDVLGSATSATVSLEIELDYGTVVETACSQDVTFSGDLIDSASASPAPNTTSQIYAPIFSIKGSDQSVTSSTTLVDCTGISFSAEANATYVVDCGWLISTGAGQLEGNFSFPSGATVNGHWVQVSGVSYYTATLAPISSDDFTVSDLATDTAYFLQSFVVITGSTSGSVQFRFAQTSSNAQATTVKAGSWIKAQRVA